MVWRAPARHCEIRRRSSGRIVGKLFQSRFGLIVSVIVSTSGIEQSRGSTAYGRFVVVALARPRRIGSELWRRIDQVDDVNSLLAAEDVVSRVAVDDPEVLLFDFPSSESFYAGLPVTDDGKKRGCLSEATYNRRKA